MHDSDPWRRVADCRQLDKEQLGYCVMDGLATLIVFQNWYLRHPSPVQLAGAVCTPAWYTDADVDALVAADPELYSLYQPGGCLRRLG